MNILVVLAIFATSRAVAVFATVCLCGFSVEVVLSFLRTRRVLGKTDV